MNVLLVTYHFRPEKTVGADRPNSIFDYAPENNIHVDVLTAAVGASRTEDESAVVRLPSSASWFKPPYSLRKIIDKSVTKLLEPFFFNIDRYWVRHIQQYTKYALKPGMYDAVYAVYPQVHAIEAALWIKKRLGLPLIIDFTDCIGQYPIEKLNSIQKRTRRVYERKLLSQCSSVITIAEGYKNYFETISPTPAHLIYNGYDENDFKDIPARFRKRVRKGKTVKIVHFGSINFSRRRDVWPLFEAIAALKTNDLISSGLQIDFIGRYTREEHYIVKKLEIESNVSFLPYMQKRKGFELISKEYDYLLFYGVQNESATVCSKLLEYLRLYKPILGICRGNEAEKIIREARAGETADFSSADIEALFLKAIQGNIFYEPNNSYISSFNRQSQAQEIFSLIRSCVNTK